MLTFLLKTINVLSNIIAVKKKRGNYNEKSYSISYGLNSGIRVNSL